MVNIAVLDGYTAIVAAVVMLGGVIGHRYLESSLRGMLIGSAALTLLLVSQSEWVLGVAAPTLQGFLNMSPPTPTGLEVIPLP